MAAVVNRFKQPEMAGGREKCFGDFCQCVAKTKSGRYTDHPLWEDQTEAISVLRDQAEKRLLEVYYKDDSRSPIRKYMGEYTGGAGGYIVPAEYSHELMRDAAEDAIFWKRAYIQRMTSKTMILPTPDPTGNVGTSQVTNFLGGIQMKWQIQPQAAANETEPSFRDVELVAYGLTGVAYSTNQLVQDYSGLDDFMRRIFAKSVAWYTDQAFLMGRGSPGSPLGVVNAPGTLYQTRQAPAAVAQADVANMMKQLIPSSWAGAIWCVSPGALQQLMNLSALMGILEFKESKDGSIGLLYGRPMYVTEKLPDLGITGDVCLIDPRLYAIGFRDLLIDYSDQDPQAFPQNKSAWRIVWRGDGTPFFQSPITLANQSTAKVSGTVVLQ